LGEVGERVAGEAFDGGLGSISSVRFVVVETCDESAVLAPITGSVVGRIRILGT
jgi:outer membrane lipoprotein SlyB